MLWRPIVLGLLPQFAEWRGLTSPAEENKSLAGRSAEKERSHISFLIRGIRKEAQNFPDTVNRS